MTWDQAQKSGGVKPIDGTYNIFFMSQNILHEVTLEAFVYTECVEKYIT